LETQSCLRESPAQQRTDGRLARASSASIVKGKLRKTTKPCMNRLRTQTVAKLVDRRKIVKSKLLVDLVAAHGRLEREKGKEAKEEKRKKCFSRKVKEALHRFSFSYRFFFYFISLSVDEVGRTWLATCS
jgi:hypothetical protein